MWLLSEVRGFVVVLSTFFWGGCMNSYVKSSRCSNCSNICLQRNWYVYSNVFLHVLCFALKNIKVCICICRYVEVTLL